MSTIRAEVTGRKLAAKRSRAERHPTDDVAAIIRKELAKLRPPLCYTINEFCEAHRLSISVYYELKKRGLGPREKKINSHLIITRNGRARVAREPGQPRLLHHHELKDSRPGRDPRGAGFELHSTGLSPGTSPSQKVVPGSSRRKQSLWILPHYRVRSRGAIPTGLPREGRMREEYFETSSKKVGRGRAQELDDLISAMYEIAQKAQPLTGRGVGYKLFVRKLIASMAQMPKVYRLLRLGREEGIIPGGDRITDELREAERVATWSNPQQYAAAVARSYRRDFWDQQPCRVEVWSEEGHDQGRARARA